MGLLGLSSLPLFNSTAYKGSKTLVLLYAVHLGADAVDIGFLIALYSLFPIALAVSAGRLADRRGARLPIMLGSAGLALSLATPLLEPNMAALYFSAALAGIAFLFFQVPAESFVGSIGRTVDRARNYSTFMFGVAVSGLIAPLIVGNGIDLYGYRSTFLLLAACPLVPIVLMLLARDIPPSAQPKRNSDHAFTHLLRLPALRRALITSCAVEGGVELYLFLMPLYGHSLGLSASSIGLVLSMNALATLVARFYLAGLAKIQSEVRILSVALLAAGSVAFLFAFVESVASLCFASFAFGLAMGCVTPMSMTMTTNRAPSDRLGEALGLRITGIRVAQTIVPIAFGAIGASLSLAAGFVVGGAILVCGAFALIRLDSSEVKRRGSES